jgi:hypothetical protein
MSLSFVTDVANTGAAKLSPAIRAEPAAAANFLYCIFYSSKLVCLFFFVCAVIAFRISWRQKMRLRHKKTRPL